MFKINNMKYEIEIRQVWTYPTGFIVEWSDKTHGFGQLEFNSEVYELNSENMGEEFCNAVFAALVKKYIKKEYLQNPACETCKWWGQKTNEVALSIDDFNQIQIEKELENKKRCLVIEKELGVEASYVDYEFEKVQSGNIYTPNNFKCSCYKML